MQEVGAQEGIAHATHHRHHGQHGILHLRGPDSEFAEPMDVHGHLIGRRTMRDHSAVVRHVVVGETDPLHHALADRAHLCAGIEYRQAAHAVELEWHQQAVAPCADAGNVEVGLLPGRHRVRTIGARAIEGDAMRRKVEVEVETEQDVSTEQPIGGAAGHVVDAEVADRHAVHREMRATEHDAVGQLGIPGRCGAADAEGARRMLEVAWQMQAVDRSLGQQRAFGAGVDQQRHRVPADCRMREQHVLARLDRHHGQPDQRTGVPGALLICAAAGAGGETEQCEQERRRSDHGVARTCTVARTEVPSASSTVSR